MKHLTILIFTIMTTLTVVAETTVYELVVYRIKASYQDSYDEVLHEARECIMKFPGIIEYQTFRSAEDNLLFMDLVKWNSLAEAKEAAQKLEEIKELAPFIAAFEEIKFMNHFELFNSEAMHKLDLTTADKEYYLAKNNPQIVTLKNYHYLQISGVSAPEDAAFIGAIEAIYAVANGVKFALKEQGKNFVIPKMECQWWVEGNLPFEQSPRSEWHWNIMIPMPDFVSNDEVEEAIQQAIAKNGVPQISEIQFKPLNTGRCLQILHIGSYDEEGPTLAKLFQFAADQGLEIIGKHHEIYISDPQHTAQKDLKTILRYAIK